MTSSSTSSPSPSPVTSAGDGTHKYMLLMLLDRGDVIAVSGAYSASDGWRWEVMDSVGIDVTQGIPEVLSGGARARPPIPRLHPVLYTTESGDKLFEEKKDSHVHCMVTCCVPGELSLYATIALDGTVKMFDWNIFSHRILISQSRQQLHGEKVVSSQLLRCREGYSSRTGNSSNSDVKNRSPHRLLDSSESPNAFAADLNHAMKSSKSNQKTPRSPRPTSKVRSSAEPAKRVKYGGVDIPEHAQKQSLYLLSKSIPNDKRITIPRLKMYLEKYHRYPAAYRPLIWRFLTKLPENESIFVDLITRPIHEAFVNLFDAYPVSDPRIFRRLQRVCSAIAHWSPIFGEVDYLVQLLFPFIIMFGSDELAAFETTLTILLYWGYSWQVTYPHPPLHVTDVMDQLLELHDNTLYRHLYKLEAPPGFMCWRMISTIYTEVLSRDVWCALMDFLFSNIDEYSYFFLSAIAIIKILRGSILTCQHSRHVASYIRLPQTVDAHVLIKHIKHLRKNTPDHLLLTQDSGQASRQLSIQEMGGVSNETQSKSVEMSNTRDSISGSEGKPVFPLPRGRYPAYDGYPPYLVDWQLKERSLALSMQRELQSRETALEELENRMEQVSNLYL